MYMYIILWDYESSDFALYRRLFDLCTSYFGIMNQYDPRFDLKINVGHLTYILWSSDFALYLEDYLMYEHHY